jgi:hypothetical protein
VAIVDSPATTAAAAAQIANVLKENFPKRFDFNYPGEWSDWVRVTAGEIAATLNLTEETATIPNVVGRVDCTCGIGPSTNEDMHSCGFTRGRFTFTPSRRLVGPWQQQP